MIPGRLHLRVATPLAVFFASGMPITVHAQSAAADTLAGRLTTDSAGAIADAEVIVTRGPDRTVFRTRTDADGRWQIVSVPGTGDYLVYLSAPGRIAQRKRLARAGGATRFTVNVALAPAVVMTLARVEVRATKREQVPRQYDGLEPARGGAEIRRDGVSGAVSPALEGDLSALAGTIPGLQSGPGGISAMGLPGSQSLVTLNGLAFGGGELPRGAETTVRAATTAWDVARGGFSGAQVDVSLSEGGIFAQRTALITVDAPVLQATDAAGRALGQRFSRVDANVAMQGPVDRADRFGYSAAARLRRTQADVPSLTNAGGDAFAASGIGADTVTRLLANLTTLGIPFGRANGTASTDAQFVGRIDRMGSDPTTFEENPRTYGLLAFFDGRDERGVGLSALGTPSTAAKSRDLNGMLQFSHALQAKLWLHDTRTAISLRDTRITPSLLLPLGIVRTANTIAEDGGIASLQFGGNDLLGSQRRRLTWESTQTSQVYMSAGTRHRFKLFGQTRIDASDESATPNAGGSFGYNSLDDLIAGRPATFSRTLTLPARSATSFNGALGIGSIYRRSSFFALQYGARLEGNRFLSRPDANAAVAQSLGIRTDVNPADIGISPRIGFRWVYAKRADDGGGTMQTRYGMSTSEVRGVLRGGIGEFRSYIDPETMAGPIAATGLTGSTLRLLCVGAAAPTPDWDGYVSGTSAIPNACANGLPTLADRAPGVRALDPSYRPARSWRGNLSWSARAFSTDISVEGIASVNRAQPSSVNANFAGIPRFTLDAESGRPMYVSESGIDGASGAVSPVASRRDTSFGSVLVAGSAARSTSTQLRITLTPPTFVKRLSLVRATWVGGRVRATENGFDRNTGADPRLFETTPGDLDVRHQLQLQGALNLGKGFGVTLFLNARSGQPFTPIVGGDINGDGISGNDRAFVTRGIALDAQFQTAMTALLAGTPSRARECLTQSLERIVGRNSCRGPWQAQLNTQLMLPAQWLKLREYTSLSVFVENPLAGIDRLVNGSNIRGWGAPAFADPVLYSVRGFDAAARRFQYDANPRFGATDPRLSTIRAPFRVTLELRAPFGAPRPQQQLSRSLRDGRNGDARPRRDADALRKTYARNVPNLYRGILSQQDSLLITPEQVTALQAADRIYTAQADSIWRELAEHLAGLGDRYDAKAAMVRQESAIDAVWELARSAAWTLDSILNPQQIKLLPFPAGYLRSIKRTDKVKVRVFMG